ncbi:MAG: homocysteine S-methyltransferase family protein, partial [Burkholderiales bacterium]
MSQYRHALPQLAGELFTTDGGLETTLNYHDRHDLPDFASFTLKRSADGVAVLRRYFERYAKIAADHR